jgi:hypothetical protein
MLQPTGSRPVYLGVRHPFEVYDLIFVTVKQLRVCLCGMPSLTIGRMQFTIAAGPFWFVVILGSETHRTYDYVLLSEILQSPNLQGQVLIFLSPRKRVVQLYSQNGRWFLYIALVHTYKKHHIQQLLNCCLKIIVSLASHFLL